MNGDDDDVCVLFDSSASNASKRKCSEPVDKAELLHQC